MTQTSKNIPCSDLSYQKPKAALGTKSRSFKPDLLEKKTLTEQLGGLRLVERRIVKRFKVDWGIKVSGTSAGGARVVETGLLRDLSTRGAYAYINSRLEIGSSVEVMIRLPLNKEGWISYPAKVLRIDPATFELGVAFIFDTARPVFVPSAYVG